MKLLILVCLLTFALSFKLGSSDDLKWEPILQGQVEATDENLLNMYNDFLVHYNKDMTNQALTM